MDTSPSAEEPFEISGTSWTSDGSLMIHFPSHPEFYYILERGTTYDGAYTPVNLKVGTEPNMFTSYDRNGEFGVFRPQDRKAFFRISRFSIADPGDIDGDGLDDLFEFDHANRFDPYKPDGLPLSHGAVRVVDLETLHTLAARDDVPGAQGLRELKFVITDVGTARPHLFFLNTHTHPYHWYFISGGLGESITLGEFNNVAYFRDDRTYLPGSIVAHDSYQHPDGRRGIYTLEFWPTDVVAYELVQLAYDMINEALTVAEGRVAYRPAGESQVQRYEIDKDQYDASGMRIISTEELYEGVDYSALNLGEGFGRLVVAGPTLTYTARDVVIFRSIPNDLSHVAGIITEIPQTPLSHINLKAKQNNTPNAYIRDATSRPDIDFLLGKYVRYAVTPDGFELREATHAEVERHLSNIRPRKGTRLTPDLETDQIMPLELLRLANLNTYGAKASNIGELHAALADIDAVSVPRGHALPFSFYDAFMRANGFYARAEEMIAREDFRTDPDVRRARLEAFREEIEDGVVPDWISERLWELQKSHPPGSRLRCRSSTNNEDLPGFNGAGLYESYTHHPDEGHLKKSVKQVWAGLWTFRAFEERDFHRIAHASVAMGVIIHPNYENERVNGVAVTKNIYDPRWEGYYVNVQVGEDLVTNPDEESVPEEFFMSVLLGSSQYEFQYVRYSNRVAQGERVLAQPQALKLAAAMKKIQSHFRSVHGIPPGNTAFAMELEFKETAEGEMAIKQARPWVE